MDCVVRCFRRSHKHLFLFITEHFAIQVQVRLTEDLIQQWMSDMYDDKSNRLSRYIEDTVFRNLMILIGNIYIIILGTLGIVI